MAGGSMLRLIQGMPNLNIYSTPWNISQRCIGNKIVSDKFKALLEKPKKPNNSFIEFKLEIEPELKRKNPNLNIRDLARLAGQLWRECPQEKKDRYKEVAERKFQKYREDLAKLERSLTPHQRAEIEELKNEMKRVEDAKLFRAEKQKKEIDFDKPKRPLNPYIRFVKSQATYSGMASKVMKDMAIKWANMPESQKKTFIHEYEKECEQFKKKLEEWENKMISLGHFDLVRSRTLKEKANQN